MQQAVLGREHAHRGDRPTFFPATLRAGEGRLIVDPLPWHGSADLRTLSDANALAFFPAGDRVFLAGETLDVHPFQ
jgi:molybdopterin biosynthesis enzyme